MDELTLKSNALMMRTTHSNDANDQAANLINWQQEFDQLSQGNFVGVINEIDFPHIHTFREQTSHSLRQQCRVENGELWLGFSTNNKSCRINNEQSSFNQFLCRSGSQDFELLTPDDFSIFGLESMLYSLKYGQRTNTAWRPLIWPIKAVMCTGFGMMILQSVSEFFKDIAIIRGVEIK